ncbi:Hpt domain-containing protein [Phenylobacterium montanum]|uniref:Hpt domain-containing protein n=1 Tax=Phenylobacterium montanum TaxID=2823693 RepID=A0A975G2D1_9CAUL|nr:Hpt domain-containing protein [Caulobacter sp. S6]QUD88736.1 Hpt domain-containing protein [Caulobacter sp. S6]
MARRDLTGAVDFAYLESYAGQDMAVVEEVLGLFREQAAIWLRLLDPVTPGDAWRDAAHTLKGAARGIGAGALAEACAAAELATGEAAGERAVLLDRVRDALDLALADIAAYLHEQAIQSLKRQA